jgi:branched-subunit amino acid aminotransferase/4-amino-4-deoxychorismate lyase
MNRSLKQHRFKMIDVLINNHWTKMTQEELQIGSEYFAFESGLYETMRTMNYKLVFLEPHLERLFSTAQKINLKIHHSLEEITEMLEKVINNFPDPNQRIRILSVPNKFIIYTSHLNLNPLIYNGVNALTVEAKRDTPEVKTTNYHVCLSALNKAIEANSFDAILCDKEGNIYEGSKSNIFWVKEGRLTTREKDVLPGTTRRTIIEKSQISVHYGLLNKKDLLNIDELLCTNSGSGIVPITEVNESTIGNKLVGRISRELMINYTNWLEEEYDKTINKT